MRSIRSNLTCSSRLTAYSDSFVHRASRQVDLFRARQEFWFARFQTRCDGMISCGDQMRLQLVSEFLDRSAARFAMACRARSLLAPMRLIPI